MVSCNCQVVSQAETLSQACGRDNGEGYEGQVAPGFFPAKYRKGGPAKALGETERWIQKSFS
jgi:hypothetical protein